MTEKGGLRGGGRETGPKEGGICIHIADSLHCTAETNTTVLKQFHYNKKWFFLIKVKLSLIISS